MRRLAIAMFGIAAIAFVALCAVLIAMAWQPAPGLVLEGAQRVGIQQLGINRQRITYVMPPGKTISNLRQSLRQHGWRKLQNLDQDQNVQFFARSLYNRTVRVIVTIRRPATNRDPVTVDVIQCLRLGDRIICP